MLHRVLVALVVGAAPSFAAGQAGAPVPTRPSALDAVQIARIDSLFAQYARPDAAGCALGVSRRDTIVLERAWGAAQLEHGVPNTPNTLFEAGSVSKQFTTAAIMLLAQRGKLSLDDDIRKYVPEVPVYDRPITIRHLIHHTSGLRDWGSVMSVAGWPRGTRAYTHAHVLDIISRQKTLNHPVGDEYLYSNSNYNLLAIIAERVSGKSLPEFTRTEIFEPLGMTRTGWRDDYRRIVPGRAQAYAFEDGAWKLDMPNENVYGNSSLLTTVGDLLRWNANFANPKVGGPEFVKAMERRGTLTSGREISYAGGLFVRDVAGAREVSHTGATAGYRALLARYPDEGWSIAILCNAANVPNQNGARIAAILMGRTPPAAVASADTLGRQLAADLLASLAGDYRSVRSDEPVRLVVRDGRLRQSNGPALIALDDRHFTSPSGRTHLLFEREASGAVKRIRVWSDDADTVDYVPSGAPVTGAALRQYAGTYRSDDAEVTYTIAVEDTVLVVRSRPSMRLVLRPAYRDGFTAPGSFVRFTRNARGQVDGFVLSVGRARLIRFDGQAAVAARR